MNVRELIVLVVTTGLLLFSSPAYSVQHNEDDVYVRIVDVGPGLCTITKVPGDHFMVYDACHWLNHKCIEAVRELVPAEGTIELMIISHSDGDHLGDADDILQEFNVRQIIRTGFPRWDTDVWKAMNKAVEEEVKDADASEWNLQSVELKPGTRYTLGDATVTFIAGWSEWTSPGPTPSEKRNAISIVVRLEYMGKYILFTGDTIGRRRGDLPEACKDAEEIMVGRSKEVPISSDVIIAPHHGGNNGSSSCFINAVAPKYVVFSAGHDHHHPTSGAAGRYIKFGIKPENIYRTDRGDDEGSSEWKQGRITGCEDPTGDDDVEIVLPTRGEVSVAYRQQADGC